MSEFLDLKLENASLDEIAELALKAVEPNSSENKSVNVKDILVIAVLRHISAQLTIFQSALSKLVVPKA